MESKKFEQTEVQTVTNKSFRKYGVEPKRCSAMLLHRLWLQTTESLAIFHENCHSIGRICEIL